MEPTATLCESTTQTARIHRVNTCFLRHDGLLQSDGVPIADGHSKGGLRKLALEQLLESINPRFCGGLVRHTVPEAAPCALVRTGVILHVASQAKCLIVRDPLQFINHDLTVLLGGPCAAPRSRWAGTLATWLLKLAEICLARELLRGARSRKRHPHVVHAVGRVSLALASDHISIGGPHIAFAISIHALAVGESHERTKLTLTGVVHLLGVVHGDLVSHDAIHSLRASI
mmetsp:Transcript_72246/g.165844  ORF Transcript_72246/g.165844 Transcript_72246/m.165844 type:complete len:230 (+) Transcript_72246:145-834(+)